jgi:prepilin-type N-terminal cleavage/methylation domain-containing protein
MNTRNILARGSNTRRRFRAGMTLVEVLLSITISATLLVSAGAAYHAAGSAVETNDQFFRSSQQARVCMAQFVKEVRQAQKILSVSATQVHLITTTGADHTWQYAAATATTPGQIQVIDNATGTSHVSATNVGYASFGSKSGLIPNKTTWPVQVSFILQVKLGQNQVVLSGGAAPRQEIAY